MSYALFFDDETNPKNRSCTKQAFRDESDINNIMAIWARTGEAPHARNAPGVYRDFTTGPDYQESMFAVKAADEAFMSLSAAIRNRFNNDPAQLIEFVAKEANLPEAEKLGLMATEVPSEGAVEPPPRDAPPEEEDLRG